MSCFVRCSSIAAIPCAPALLSACSHALRTAREARDGEPAVTVETYNVNFGLGGDAATLEAMSAPDADLVVLEETAPTWERAVRAELGRRYPHQVWLHDPRGAAGGLAALSRAPFEVRDVLDNPGGWFPALSVVAETELGPVQVLAMHLHPPVTEDGAGCAAT